MKPREKIINQSYLSINDIRSLLLISFKKAKELFLICKEREVKEVGKFRPYENKVQIETVLRVTGKRLSTLQEQIKSGHQYG